MAVRIVCVVGVALDETCLAVMSDGEVQHEDNWMFKIDMVPRMKEGRL